MNKQQKFDVMLLNSTVKIEKTMKKFTESWFGVTPQVLEKPKDGYSNTSKLNEVQPTISAKNKGQI